jgi:hypothetical protein
MVMMRWRWLAAREVSAANGGTVAVVGRLGFGRGGGVLGLGVPLASPTPLYRRNEP